MYFYSDTSVREHSGPIDVWRMNGTKQFLKHYENFLTLSFMAKETPDRLERHSLEKELEICRRKLSFWSKHPNYSVEAATLGVQRLKAAWSKSAIPAPRT